ncbi:MAG: DUF115 domain-containing protein [Leptospira sp.]|nr:DUF115 domain-containing protein [Leptospira sp.]
MNPILLQKNLSYLKSDFSVKIQNATLPVELQKSKTGEWTLELEGRWIHSRFDPITEAKRFADELPEDGSQRVYLLFGAGLGHILPFLLKRENCFVIWMEPNEFFLKVALSIYDFSESLLSEKLIIIPNEKREDLLIEAFKGKGTYPISFVPHRGSWQWKETDYLELRNIAEQMFHKKDVNLATLTRFEKIWAKNICFNLPELAAFTPVSKLFGLANGIDIVVAGAGPSLSHSIPNLKKFRSQFLLLAVDTAVPILSSFGVDPDLIYSVDPQSLNSQYLEDYHGDGILVFDPTSTYMSLRLDAGPVKGFVTTSPFPLIQILEKSMEVELGAVPFGGSVSTNAASLASLMGAKNIYFIGQDLSFTFGLAHSKGAILEERLNFLENRKFRREKHNYKQLFALPQKKVEGILGNSFITNEKMLIFKKWFEDHADSNPWKNLTANGAKLDGIPSLKFEDCFSEIDENLKELVLSVKSAIRETLKIQNQEKTSEQLKAEIQKVIPNLIEFQSVVQKGMNLSKKIYSQIKNNQVDPKRFSNDLKQMDAIDTIVSEKKGLNEMLSLGIQRVILTITEGYDSELDEADRSNEQLEIAKKSLLLYEGLNESISSIKRMLKKSLFRLESY